MKLAKVKGWIPSRVRKHPVADGVENRQRGGPLSTRMPRFRSPCNDDLVPPNSSNASRIVPGPRGRAKQRNGSGLGTDPAAVEADAAGVGAAAAQSIGAAVIGNSVGIQCH